MIKITVHRPNQIGGCITEIVTGQSKIIIDLGHNLPVKGQVAEDEKANEAAISELTEGCDAVFYTHYHGDHVDLFRFVKQTACPQYIGETAKEVMLCKYKWINKRHKDASLLEKIKSFKTYKAPESIKIGNINVTPFFVSHSACDAHMFLIETERLRILHTGDFRGHGYLSGGLPKILSCIGTVDVLITEGTMLSRANNRKVKTEDAVSREMEEIMLEHKYVFVLTSSTDNERLAAVQKASKRADRVLVCDKYQKEMLRIFTQEYMRNPKVPDLFDYSDSFLLNYCSDKVIRYLKNKGFCMLVRPYSEKKIERLLRKLGLQPDSEEVFLIYSAWDGYYNREDTGDEKYISMRDFFKQKKDIHTSGHADIHTLNEVCTIVQPRLAIVPIHRDKNTDFAEHLVDEKLKDKVMWSDYFRSGDLMIQLK